MKARTHEARTSVVGTEFPRALAAWRNWSSRRGGCAVAEGGEMTLLLKVT
jgi:hypothetical protein